MIRRILLGLAISLSPICVHAADRVTTLPPLPDVGEPFDVRKFCAVSVPDDKNAFTYYRRAARAFVPLHKLVPASEQDKPQFSPDRLLNNFLESIEEGWPHANAITRRYLKENEFALEIWKRGTDCDDALEIPPAELSIGKSLSSFHQPARELARLVWLEAQKVSGGKRPVDAWQWYRAVLRSSCHLSMHSITIGHLVGCALYDGTVFYALRWAARPEIAASDLRQALADTLAANAMMPPPSDSLKCDYLWSRTGIDGAIEAGARDLAPILEHVGYRERMRRSLNLVYANLLSQADRPRYLRAPFCGKLGLFGPDPGAPRSPTVLSDKVFSDKVLSDAEIERLILSVPGADAQIMQYLAPPIGVVNSFDIQRVRQSAFVLGLALQLNYREHRQFPATLDGLVKNGYLKSIPADPFGKGEPFHYRRETNPQGGAVLWSVWTDGIDQQGKLDVWRDHSGGKGDRIYKIATPVPGT
jgi:hypothetical protein